MFVRVILNFNPSPVKKKKVVTKISKRCVTGENIDLHKIFVELT